MEGEEKRVDGEADDVGQNIDGIVKDVDVLKQNEHGFDDFNDGH